MWENINSFWLWLSSNKSLKLFKRDKLSFYNLIKRNIETIYGQFYNTTLRDEPFYFMKLGMMMERLNQTARVLDVKSHRIAFQNENKRESALETLYWLSLLKFVSASESFLKCSELNFNRKNVASFLIFDESFPRTILFCLLKTKECLQKLHTNNEFFTGVKTIDFLQKQLEMIKSSNIKSVFNTGLHVFLTEVINKSADICDLINKEFFDPEDSIPNHFKRIA